MNVTFKKVINNPYVNFIGLILGIVSLFMGVYFYYASKKEPFLTMYELPRRTVVVSPNKSTNIEFFYQNKKISEEVVATSIVVWNMGRAPIRNDSILENIQIYAEAPIKIYEAKIIETTNDWTGFSLDDKETDMGYVALKWKILEPNDGALIQIIHSRTEGEAFNISGAIESQGEVRKYSSLISRDKINNFLGAKKDDKNNERKAGIVTMIIGIITLTMPFMKRKKRVAKKDYMSFLENNFPYVHNALSSRKFATSLLILMAVLNFSLGLSIYLAAPPEMPFSELN